MPSNFFDIIEFEGKQELPDGRYIGYDKGFDKLVEAKAFAKKVFPAAKKRAAKLNIKNYSLAVLNERNGNVLLRLK